MAKTIRALAILCIASQLSGCIAAATTAAAQGATVAAQERSIHAASTDARIQVQINDKLFRHSTDLFSRVDITVNEGKVLLTGTVPKAEHRAKASELAWQVPGVTQVINELMVKEGSGVSGYASDSWLLTKIRSKMIFDGSIVSINYTVDAVDGTIYLTGIAQDVNELDRVRTLIQNTAGVKNLISYVRLKSELPYRPK